MIDYRYIKLVSEPSAKRRREPPTKTQLRAWLMSLPEKHRFGTDSDDCVIAQYTGRHTGFLFCDGRRMDLWLTKFIVRFCEGRGRSAKAALTVLEKIR